MQPAGALRRVSGNDELGVLRDAQSEFYYLFAYTRLMACGSHALVMSQYQATLEGNAVTTPAPGPPATTFDVEKYVGGYVRLRDKIAEIEERHKEELKPHKALLDKLNNLLLEHLLSQKAENIATSVGTVYRHLQDSFSAEDVDAFRRHVIGSEAWELLDWKANKTSAKAFMDEHKAPPPGIKYNARYVAGIRRK
jgi:hypothetical protein